jgi:predicted nucleotidyltransferase
VIIREARPDEHAAVGELRVVAYRTLGLLPEGSGYAETLRGFGFADDCVVLVAASEAANSILGTGFSRTPDLDFEPVPGIILRAYELVLPPSPFPGQQPDKRPVWLSLALRNIAALAHMPSGLGGQPWMPVGFRGLRRAFVTKRCRKACSVRSRNAVRSRRKRPGQPVHSPSVGGHQGTHVGQQTGIPMICQTGSMDEARAAEVMAESAAALRKAGARFAYLHGSRASGQYRPDSDVDIAAYFGGQPTNAFDILLPPGVDLLVLDHAPLELAGRVAARGRLLFDDDPVSRVRWEATTRKIYFDEIPRITRAHREFAASVTGRRG